MKACRVSEPLMSADMLDPQTHDVKPKHEPAESSAGHNTED